MQLALLLVGTALLWASTAAAHGPATSIGRAVEAFGSVSVSYEPGAAVSDIEAGNFPHVVGSNPKVAFLRPEAREELAGGLDAIAEEIAREARLHGTLVVLVGTKLGAWSDQMDDDRLADLVADAQATEESATPAEMVGSLVRSVQAESADTTPWGWLGGFTVVALGSLLVLGLLSRRHRRA